MLSQALELSITQLQMTFYCTFRSKETRNLLRGPTGPPFRPQHHQLRSRSHLHLRPILHRLLQVHRHRLRRRHNLPPLLRLSSLLHATWFRHALCRFRTRQKHHEHNAHQRPRRRRRWSLLLSVRLRLRLRISVQRLHRPSPLRTKIDSFPPFRLQLLPLPVGLRHCRRRYNQWLNRRANSVRCLLNILILLNRVCLPSRFSLVLVRRRLG